MRCCGRVPHLSHFRFRWRRNHSNVSSVTWQDSSVAFPPRNNGSGGAFPDFVFSNAGAFTTETILNQLESASTHHPPFRPSTSWGFALGCVCVAEIFVVMPMLFL